MLKFVNQKPAIIADDILVLGDIHIGLEHSLSGKGIRLGQMLFRMSEEISRIIDEHKPKQVVMLGDVKHSVPETEIEEREDVISFIEKISSFIPVTIVPGNHDGNIKNILRNVDVTVSEPQGTVIGDMGFFHGHAWPETRVISQKTVFMGHQHPLVEISERIGAKHIMRVWCMGNFSERIHERYPEANIDSKVILVPAFNPLLGGTPLNRRKGRELLGPIMRNKIFKLEDAQLYLLNGLPLGKMRDLEESGKEEG